MNFSEPSALIFCVTVPETVQGKTFDKLIFFALFILTVWLYSSVNKKRVAKPKVDKASQTTVTRVTEKIQNVNQNKKGDKATQATFTRVTKKMQNANQNKVDKATQATFTRVTKEIQTDNQKKNMDAQTE